MFHPVRVMCDVWRLGFQHDVSYRSSRPMGDFGFGRQVNKNHGFHADSNFNPIWEFAGFLFMQANRQQWYQTLLEGIWPFGLYGFRKWDHLLKTLREFYIFYLYFLLKYLSETQARSREGPVTRDRLWPIPRHWRWIGANFGLRLHQS